MWKRFTQYLRLVFQLFELLVTLRPAKRGARSCKVFGRPSHAGGPQTKYAQLQRACAGRWETYSTLICLSAVRVPLPALRLFKSLGARVTVNQNGVYYPSWYPAGWEQKNAYLRGLNQLADHTFFQSEFSVDSYRRWVGEPPGNRSILYNAVDREFFHEDREGPKRMVRPRVLVFLDFREINRAAWSYFSGLANEATDLEWVWMGREETSAIVSELRAVPSGKRAEWVLSPSAEMVAKTIRSCDVALHFVYNDVCPNKVLECLASGVYVICSSAGGTKELVTGGGGEVLQVKDGYGAPEFPESAIVLASLKRATEDAYQKRIEARGASARFDLGDWVKLMTGRT